MTQRGMKLKKAPKPTGAGRVVKPKIYMISTGSYRQQTTPTGYASEKSAKEKAVEFFDDWRAWCRRHNPPGNAEIDSAVAEIQSMPVLLREHRVVVRCIDDYTQMTLCVHLWKEDG